MTSRTQLKHLAARLLAITKAKEMGYEAVIVEGNPRGFKTSCDYGIVASPSVGLPAPECLMVKELVEAAPEHIKGVADYSDYECLR